MARSEAAAHQDRRVAELQDRVRRLEQRQHDTVATFLHVLSIDKQLADLSVYLSTVDADKDLAGRRMKLQLERDALVMKLQTERDDMFKDLHGGTTRPAGAASTTTQAARAGPSQARAVPPQPTRVAPAVPAARTGASQSARTGPSHPAVNGRPAKPTTSKPVPPKSSAPRPSVPAGATATAKPSNASDPGTRNLKRKRGDSEPEKRPPAISYSKASYSALEATEADFQKIVEYLADDAISTKYGKIDWMGLADLEKNGKNNYAWKAIYQKNKLELDRRVLKLQRERISERLSAPGP